jgi:hypothetical protein
VRRDPHGDPRPAGQPLHGAVGGGAIHPLTVGVDEDRSVRSFSDVEVERPSGTRGERDRHPFAALAQHPQRPVSALDVQIRDVGAERFGDPQPVQRQQRDQR